MEAEYDALASSPDTLPAESLIPDLVTGMMEGSSQIAYQFHTPTTGKISRRALIREGIKAGLGTTALGSLFTACGGGGSGGPVTIQFAAYVDTTGEQTVEINTFNQM